MFDGSWDDLEVERSTSLEILDDFLPLLPGVLILCNGNEELDDGELTVFKFYHELKLKHRYCSIDSVHLKKIFYHCNAYNIMYILSI